MKRVTGLSAKVAYQPYTFCRTDEHSTRQCEASTIEDVRHMAKESWIEDFAKLNYDGNAIQIKHVDVYIEKVKEYSDDFPESSPTYKTYLRTYCKTTQREIFSNVKVHKNPEYDGNPECEFCYKKVTEVFADHLLDSEKTEKKVCRGCRKTLSQMRKILAKKKLTK